jgi:hypothetical protein
LDDFGVLLRQDQDVGLFISWDQHYLGMRRNSPPLELHHKDWIVVVYTNSEEYAPVLATKRVHYLDQRRQRRISKCRD